MKKKKVDTISKKRIEEFEELRIHLEILKDEAADRMQYILDEIKRVCCKNTKWIEYWDWPGENFTNISAEDEWCHLDHSITEASASRSDRFMVILADGEEHDFMYLEIPMKWLFEDFEDELSTGRELYLQKKEKKASQKQKKRAEKQEKTRLLVEAAKRKLTPEERKALNLS